MSDLNALVEALRPRRKALAALWEACTVECPCARQIAWLGDTNSQDFAGAGFSLCNDCNRDAHSPECIRCADTGRVPRDVAEWPSGAVAGMLGHAIAELPCSDSDRWNTALCFATEFEDLETLAAVLEAVRAVPEDGDAAGETT